MNKTIDAKTLAESLSWVALTLYCLSCGDYWIDFGWILARRGVVDFYLKSSQSNVRTQLTDPVCICLEKF